MHHTGFDVNDVKVMPFVADFRSLAPWTRRDRLLKAKEVAERLGVGIDWVYHNQLRPPFRVRLGTVQRFSENGLDDFIRMRQGT